MVLWAQAEMGCEGLPLRKSMPQTDFPPELTEAMRLEGQARSTSARPCSLGQEVQG